MGKFYQPFLTLLTSLALFSLGTSCGVLDPYLSQSTAPEGFTRVTISPKKEEFSLFDLQLFRHFSLIENAQAANQLLGGLMLYLVGQSGTDFYGSYYLTDETVIFNKVLPNGTYRYLAYGFMTRGLGAAATLNTPIDVAKCAFLDAPQAPVSLNGTDLNITIDLSTLNCANLGLGPAAPLNPVTVYSCSPTGMTFVTPASAPSSACSTPGYAGSMLSYQVALKQREISNGIPNAAVEAGAKMISPCMGISTTYPSNKFFPFALPLGVRNIWGKTIPFPLAFKTFNTANCTPDPVGIYGLYDFQGDLFQGTPINITGCTSGVCSTPVADTNHKVVFVDQSTTPNEARVYLRNWP